MQKGRPPPVPACYCCDLMLVMTWEMRLEVFTNSRGGSRVWNNIASPDEASGRQQQRVQGCVHRKLVPLMEVSLSSIPSGLGEFNSSNCLSLGLPPVSTLWRKLFGFPSTSVFSPRCQAGCTCAPGHQPVAPNYLIVEKLSTSVPKWLCLSRI